MKSQFGGVIIGFFNATCLYVKDTDWVYTRPRAFLENTYMSMLNFMFLEK